MRRAFITGVSGQDGSYLAELLLQKGYEVHAILRRASVFTSQRIDHLFAHPRFKTYHGDLTDSSNLYQLLARIQPHEVYNLGAQSHVAVSFEVPEYTADVDALGTVRLLSAIRELAIKPRFYQASTSEMFGGLPGTAPQSESTPFYPKSPYGAAKLYSYWLVVNYRESYNLFACNGILFNHESPRRGETFVTKKITKAAARIAQGKQSLLTLGNLDAKRDWGHAREYVEAMWLMLQQDIPRDFVIATGQTYTVREFATWAFADTGITLEWRGVGENEQGVDQKTGATLISIDPRYYRPAEVELLQGDATLAKQYLGWSPKISARELAREMVAYDLAHDHYGADGVAILP